MAKYIIASDLHLRPDRPLCRLDPDWYTTQRDMMNEIVSLANSNNADLLICGDIFDVPNVPSSILSLFIETIMVLKKGLQCHVIAGNHSLPWHKQENLQNSSIGVIASLEGVNGFPVTYHPCDDNTADGIFEHSCKVASDISMVHTLTFKKEDDIPFGAKGYTASQLLEKYPDSKYICTGDNHTNFVYKEGKRYVINPGSTSVQTANAIDYCPVVYLLDDVEVEVESIKLKYHDSAMITSDHLKEKHERDDRISAFVERVQNSGQMSLSFVDNLYRALDASQAPEGVRNIIRELEEEHGGA